MSPVSQDRQRIAAYSMSPPPRSRRNLLTGSAVDRCNGASLLSCVWPSDGGAIMSKPLIRNAEPRDAAFVAWTVQAADRSHLARGWFDITLDRSESECLEFLRRLALAQTRSWWHYSLFLIAEVDGVPASGLCRFRSGDGYPLSGPAMTEVAHSYGWGEGELGEMWRRASYVRSCIMPSSDDRWIIENVATRPEYRGRGLTGMLIERAVEDGRARGFNEA